LPFGPARNGAVVWAVDGDLFIADELNGAPRPLVSGPDVDSDPVFSRQGDRIAFVRGQDRSRIVAVSSDGTELTELATVPGLVQGIGWSPPSPDLLARSFPGESDPVTLANAQKALAVFEAMR